MTLKTPAPALLPLYPRGKLSGSAAILSRYIFATSNVNGPDRPEQKAKRANRVKPRPKDGGRPGKFLSIATCSAGATPVRQPGAGKVLAGGDWVIRAPVE